MKPCYNAIAISNIPKISADLETHLAAVTTSGIHVLIVLVVYGENISP